MSKFLTTVFACIAVASIQLTPALAQQDFGGTEGKKPGSGSSASGKYDVNITGFGSTYEEVFEEHGIVLNQFETYG